MLSVFLDSCWHNHPHHAPVPRRSELVAKVFARIRRLHPQVLRAPTTRSAQPPSARSGS